MTVTGNVGAMQTVVTYKITGPTLGALEVVADDFTVGEGLVVFRDEIGRAIEAVVMEDGLRITASYSDDDEMMVARRALADAERAATVRSMQARVAELTKEAADALG